MAGESVPLFRRLRRLWWRRRRWRRPAAYTLLVLLAVLAAVLVFTRGPDRPALLNLPDLVESAAGPLPQVQELIDAGRLTEAEVLLNRLPEKHSPEADAVRAQLLIFSSDPEIKRGTGLIQAAVKREPDLLDYRPVRRTLVETLNVRNGKQAIEFVVKQGGEEVVYELVTAATDRRYWLRWNSIEALKQLEELDRVDKVLVYIADLKYAGSCNTRKKAARQLARLKDDRALEPLRQAQNRGFLANLCMGDTLEEAIRQIEE